MKLRNKETGKIRDFEFVAISKESDELIAKIFNLDAHHAAPVMICRSIDQLNEEWEDYVPAEPLIEDEKIRKAIKEWFNANNFGCRSLQYYKDGYSRSHFVHAKGNTMKIFFREEIGNLKDGDFYDIDKLCGEDDSTEPLESTFVDLDEQIREQEDKK